MSNDVEIFLEIPQIPVLCNVLSDSRVEATQVPRSDLKLGFSPTCGHVFNYAFDPRLLSYSQTYENSLHFSPRFQQYAAALSDRLIERYDLYEKNIVELGCGKGDFLNMLCEGGNNRGIGFDPSYEPELGEDYASERFTVIQDLYNEKYAHLEADLICCRHVLEHIDRPVPFLKTVRRAVGSRMNTAIFFEVPNALFTLRDLAIWDLIYEHCSYFSPPSLTYLFQHAGFDITDVSTVYEGQFLSIDAHPSPGSLGGDLKADIRADDVAKDVISFTSRYHDKVSEWQNIVDGLVSNEQRAVLWGAGSKGVTILNILNIEDQIEYVIDINPRKEGKYVAGTAQQIASPRFLRDYRPDLIIVMNKIYLEEIRAMTREMGLNPEFVTA